MDHMLMFLVGKINMMCHLYDGCVMCCAMLPIPLCYMSDENPLPNELSLI